MSLPDSGSSRSLACVALFDTSFDVPHFLGTNRDAMNSKPMVPRSNKPKPIIPEPSPRFLSWSCVAGALLVTTIIVLDYTTGWLR
jgi:hypothetical protein